MLRHVRHARPDARPDLPVHPARRVRPARPVHPARRGLPGILLAVLLAVFGGTAAVPQQASAAAGTQAAELAQVAQLAHSGGQSANPYSAGTHHQDPPEHYQGAIAHNAHAATHAPLPLLPAVEQDAREPLRGSVLPQRPRLSPTQLTHRSPCQGRAPPACTGI